MSDFLLPLSISSGSTIVLCTADSIIIMLCITMNVSATMGSRPFPSQNDDSVIHGIENASDAHISASPNHPLESANRGMLLFIQCSPLPLRSGKVSKQRFHSSPITPSARAISAHYSPITTSNSIVPQSAPNPTVQ